MSNIYIGNLNNEQQALLNHRAKFSAQYFKEHGWDIENPTIEQVIEVRNQPGWKEIPKEQSK